MESRLKTLVVSCDYRLVIKTFIYDVKYKQNIIKRSVKVFNTQQNNF